MLTLMKYSRGRIWCVLASEDARVRLEKLLFGFQAVDLLDVTLRLDSVQLLQQVLL